MSGDQDAAKQWAESEDKLLSTQRSALQIILRECVQIIGRALTGPVNEKGKDTRTVLTPHEVFCIDGGRGSGKTFTLSSLPHALDALSDRCLRNTSDKPVNWKQILDKVDKIEDGKEVGFLGERIPAYEASHGNKKPEALARVLRIIFPGDMEGGESVMETFFAALLQDIDEQIEIHKKGGGVVGEEKTNEYEELKKQLRRVAAGFYFAKRFGVDAIIRDSVDYEDLVTQFETQSEQASHRTRTWRSFVYNYLEKRNIPVLVILLDDSDVEADLTRDILHAIRMFLCHPRIITVLAGNTRSMRDSLVHYGMRRLGASMAALDRSNRRTAQDWRQAMRKDAEYYLEKVLPQDRRYFIGPPSFTSAESTSDFEKIADKDFRSVIAKRLELSREDFLEAKFRLATNYENGQSDAPNKTQWREIEEFLSWWLFATRYAAPLAPKSARQIRTFRTYYVASTEDDAGASDQQDEIKKKKKKQEKQENLKRLPVMLHDIPENWTLVQRLSDNDASLVAWLWQQELKSVWTGQRSFQINGRSVYQGTYTYDYIRYRFDVNFATPMRKNSEEAVPKGLLPVPRGRRYMRRFFRPVNMQRQQRRVGLARWIDHAALPGNCVYFCELAALPDLSFVPNNEAGQNEANRLHRRIADPDTELNKGEWEAGLAGRWMELLAEEQNERLVRYLTDVTFERLRETKGVKFDEVISILNPETNRYEDFLRHERNEIEESRREIEKSSSEGEKSGLTPEEWHHAKRLLVDPSISASSPAISKAKLVQAHERIARHAALISDLRRAWHAIRIHEIAPQRPIESGESAGPREEMERTSNAIIANQGRMALFSRTDIEKILNHAPWIASLLIKFRELPRMLPEAPSGTLPEAISAYTPEQHKSALRDTIKPFYTLSKDIQSDVQAELISYKEWVGNLRTLGRAICGGWPVYDQDADKIRYDAFNKPNSFEKEILHAEQLDISLDISSDLDTSPEDVRDRQLRYGRETRNFVMLLYGLAPSLSALVHTQVMAEIFHRNFLREDRTDIVKEATRELREWAELVGTLSVLLRYLKIKCMHLFAKIFIDRMNSDIELGGAHVERAVEFLGRCRIGVRDTKTNADVGAVLRF